MLVIIIEFIPIVVIMPLNERAVCKHCYKIFELPKLFYDKKTVNLHSNLRLR